jgi:hypothetical protein
MMNIAQIYARNTDGVIRRVETSNDNFGVPEAGTTRVARFDATAYNQHYSIIINMLEFVRFVEGALVLEHPVLGTSTIATAQWIADREAEVVVRQFDAAQVGVARSDLSALMSGLSGLSATDKGYAVYCRLFAWRNGANQATIEGIINRATATTYITNLPEWQNLPIASRAFNAKVLETNAALCQVLVLVLSG